MKSPPAPLCSWNPISEVVAHREETPVYTLMTGFSSLFCGWLADQPTDSEYYRVEPGNILRFIANRNELKITLLAPTVIEFNGTI